MKTISSYTVIILFTLFYSCKKQQNKTEVKKIEAKSLFFSNNNIKQPESLFPAPQIFKLHNNDTIIVTHDSINIYLPKNLFIDKDAKVVENYSLYFISVFEKDKMVFSNLQTLADSALLESSGMFNINAFDEYGNPLIINSAKFIGIEMKSKTFNKETRLYYGENKDGNINWTEPSEPEKYLVNIPLPVDNWVLNYHFEHDYDTSGKTQKILESYIATREFLKTRLPRSGFDSAAYFKIYMNNLDKNLYESDSLCIVHEKSNRYKWSDKFKKGFYTYDKNSKTGMYVDTSEYYLHYLEKLTKPKVINTYGINLDKPNAREQLKKKGLTERQIDEAFVIHNRRKRIMQSMESEKKYTLYFEINKLGWYNFDKELGFDNAQYVSLRTNLSGAPLQYTSLYYVLDNYNSVIGGHNISGNSFSISPQNNYQAKLPINEPFTAVAISYTENGILVASEKFKVKQKNEMELHLKPISEDSLKLYLSDIVKK